MTDIDARIQAADTSSTSLAPTAAAQDIDWSSHLPDDNFHFTFRGKWRNGINGTTETAGFIVDNLYVAISDKARKSMFTRLRHFTSQVRDKANSLSRGRGSYGWTKDTRLVVWLEKVKREQKFEDTGPYTVACSMEVHIADPVTSRAAWAPYTVTWYPITDTYQAEGKRVDEADEEGDQVRTYRVQEPSKWFRDIRTSGDLSRHDTRGSRVAKSGRRRKPRECIK